MAKNDSSTKDSLAEKFEFFFIGLIFTVLGASIQTADFSVASVFVISTEIISWFLFLISGLVGLIKLEKLPNVVYLRDQIQNKKGVVTELQVMSKNSDQIYIPETQEYKNIGHIIDEINNSKEKYEEAFLSHIEKHKTKNLFQRWCFYIGFILIAISRSFDHINSIILCTV
jgi:hypothetical protein